MELRSRPRQSRRVLCLVSLPDSSVFQVELKSQSSGLEVLLKVCELLGIVESDYFGLLQQTAAKCEHIWLNLRNPLATELSGSPPHRLMLRVKFYIKPHMIQQLTSRHQFYLNVREALNSRLISVVSLSEAISISALIAQIDHGDETKLDNQWSKQSYIHILSSYCSIGSSDEVVALVAEAHKKLHGISLDNAKYQLLQAVSELPSYGIQYYDARMNRGGDSIHIAVGPDGIIVYDSRMKELNRMPYTTIKKVTHDGQNVILQAIDGTCETVSYLFRLDAKISASALYRAMTEMYYFYRCDTVDNDVMLQYCRDLKGTLVSLFNENSNLGKSYMFDIERTRTEAYDRARRVLFARNTDNVQSSTATSCALEINACKCQSFDKCQMLQESVQQISDCLTCHVCFDAHINTSFVPCGHTMCCSDCAQRLDLCPLCKVGITFKLKVFLPWTYSPIEQLTLCSHSNSSLLHSVACR